MLSMLPQTMTRTSSRRSARLLNGTGGLSSADDGLSFDVIQSGPTRTTATLTPTTLRNIEQTYLDLSSETDTQVPHQAGFVPPMAPFPPFATTTASNSNNTTATNNLMNSINNSASNGSGSITDEDFDEDQHMMTTTDRSRTQMLDDDGNSVDSESMSNCSWQTGQTTETPPPQTQRASEGKPKRNMGGRRPNKATNLSPEEEEKRQMRRERNKLAAARCRKRRVDHTNELMGEVEGLEKKKQFLQSDIQKLQQQKEELEFLLEAHRDHCRMLGRAASPLDIKPAVNFLALADKIKSEPVESFETMAAPAPVVNNSPKRNHVDHILATGHPHLLNNNPLMSASATSAKLTSSSGLPLRPNRPSSLAVPLTITPSQALAGVKSGDFAGIPISTPSTGIFNFESLMDGGTGLTPVAAPLVPTSTGLAAAAAAAANRNPMELVTPTSEPSKLVSL